MSNENKTATDWTGVAALLVLASFFGGACILLWQVYGYLRFESWQPLSLVDVLSRFEVRWAIAPTDWLGLHRILEWMPLSVLVPIIGLVLALIVGWLDANV
jgi:hypothetical protein